MAKLSEFKEKFSKSITLRNELVPIGMTLENIKKKNIIEDDKKRSEDYKQAKKIIDNFHRSFIESSLSKCNFNWDSLANILLESVDAGDSDLKAKDELKLKEIQDSFRKDISLLFKNYVFEQKRPSKKKNEPSENEQNLTYDDIFKEGLFNVLLPSVLSDSEEKRIIEGFDKFTTYFKGFHENRENMYSDEAQSTAISYRIVHDNFPKFLSNISVFNNWKKFCPQCISQAESVLKEANVLNNEETLEELFKVSSFNRFVNQSGIDFYNKILGGLPASEGQVKVTGLNEIVNLACQKDTELTDNLKKKHSRKMTVLFKQILSDRESSFVIEEFYSDKELIAAVKNFYCFVLGDNGCEKILFNLIEKLKDFDCSKVFVQGKNICNLSKDLYGAKDWSLIKAAICKDKADDKSFKKLIKADPSEDALDKFISKSDYALDYLSKVTGKDVVNDIILCLNEKKNNLKKVNSENWPESIKSSEEKEQIKNILDALLNLFRFEQIFLTNNFDRDLNFYADYDLALNDFSYVMKLYNKVRNYATKKPYSLEKFKLNFNNPQLADGWSETKESDYLSVIFKKDKKYYLGIFNKYDKPDFSGGHSLTSENSYQKMKYLQFKDFSKMLPKCSFTNAVKSHFEKSDDDYSLFDSDKFVKPLIITKEIFLLNCAKGIQVKKFQKAYQKINEKEYRSALTKWIEFGKDFLSSYRTTSLFNTASLKEACEYSDLTEFYNDVDNITYKIDWVNIDSAYIDNLVNEGKLYLFQIYNKDFAKGHSGNKNLHTLYLESIFDERNAELGVIKLNGYAELFYRYSSIDDKNKISHLEKTKLVNRTYIDATSGRSIQIPDEYYHEIYKYVNGRMDRGELSVEVQKYLRYAVVKEATHTITKDRRFTSDKFFFHCPITINYKASSPVKFNDKVMSFLRGNKDINIIGLDRGERNLIYATVINQNGDILECKSFNTVSHTSSNVNYDVDYHEKLELKELEREAARRSWNTVSKIASLKEGYLSSVIHELAKLMIKHNAIIVLENLNMGFKRVRGGIAERSVYQKFEKMLIDKLNYLVFKTLNWTEAGGLLNGYQLTNQFTSFKDISSQSGFLFYVPAAFTSKIDPSTGFVNAISFGRYKNSSEFKNLFSNFDSISYVKDEDLFKFSIDYSKLKVSYDMAVSKWDIYSFGTRITRSKNEVGKYIEDKNYKPTEKLKDLFNKYGLDYSSGNNLLDIIVKNEKFNARFWTDLFHIFKNILQIRNSSAGTMEDYLISPVKNCNGDFFDSANADGTPYKLLKDADANGAYHIALKGLLLLQKNNLVTTDAEIKKVRTLSSKEWFKFVQQDIRKH